MKARLGALVVVVCIAVAEQDSGMQLDHFFDVWLYQPDKPTSW